MKSFSNYLNKIKAEEELKEKTKVYIQEVLAQKSQENTHTFEKVSLDNRKTSKKLLAPFVSVAACALLLIGGFAYYNTPVSYLSLDINPSIELGINAFDKVVTVESYNDDGAALLKESDLNGLTMEEAINNLVQNAADQGFIADDGSTVIAITAETNQADNAVNLQNSGEAGVNAALAAKSIPAIVYTDCSDLALRTQAKALGISPGKYKLILILQALDPAITVDQYRNTKVTDIITRVHELLKTADPEQYQEYNTAIEMIQNAAQKVQLAKETRAREQNRNGIQDQNSDIETQGQQHIQNQFQNQFTAEPEQGTIQTQGTTTPEQGQNRNQGTSETTPDTDSNAEQGDGVDGSQTQTTGTEQKQQGSSDSGKKGP